MNVPNVMTRCKFLIAMWMLAALWGCASSPKLSALPMAKPSIVAAPAPEVQVFTVVGAGGKATVRALTASANCPLIAWDGQPATPMSVRVGAGTVPARGDGAQADNKAAVFDVLVCENLWQAGAKSARVQSATGVWQSVPAPTPAAAIKRIVVVGDTGCRMKGSEAAFQACNDESAWPWAAVARSAAATKPDLVIHVGDIHYRESPCPQGLAGCAGSPWGYGFDAWRADLFEPAKPLLAAAPWVFVRGNHESCSRAGQGWFRFVDSQPWDEARSCNSPRLDTDADYSAPYAVPLSKDAQLIVFDSSKTSGKSIPEGSIPYKKYIANLHAVTALTKNTAHSFFASHHPLLAIGVDKKTKQIAPAGNGGMLSVMGQVYPDRLFAAGVEAVMHGHNHVFQAMDFKSDHPVSMVMGNSASQNEIPAPAQVPQGFEPYAKAVVDHYAAYPNYGFATLDAQPSGAWLLTEYSVAGKPVVRCELANRVTSPLAANQMSKATFAMRQPLATADGSTADASASKPQALAIQIGCSSAATEH
jgi:Calcineurin-like phosphoesterase